MGLSSSLVNIYADMPAKVHQRRALFMRLTFTIFCQAFVWMI